MTSQATGRLTGKKVTRAFGGVGLGPVRFVTPIHRNGRGWQFIIDLPPWLTLAVAATRSQPLARNLGVEPDRLVLGRTRGGPENRIDVWIGD